MSASLPSAVLLRSVAHMDGRESGVGTTHWVLIFWPESTHWVPYGYLQGTQPGWLSHRVVLVRRLLRMVSVTCIIKY